MLQESNHLDNKSKNVLKDDMENNKESSSEFEMLVKKKK